MTDQPETNDDRQKVDEYGAASQDAPLAKDTPYTDLDEVGYESLDEENDREVSSRGGVANYTQNVEADPEDTTDDAAVREGELPVQNEDLNNQ